MKLLELGLPPGNGLVSDTVTTIMHNLHPASSLPPFGALICMFKRPQHHPGTYPRCNPPLLRL